LQLIYGDCLEKMKDIPDNSIDMVFADLPYGTTYAKWDKIIPMSLLWKEYERIVKKNSAICLTASQPFTSFVICSKPEWFRCEWIWNKVNPTNFANAKKHSLKQHEQVLVFGKNKTVYYPQKVKGKCNHVQGKSTVNKSETRLISDRVEDDLSGMKYPKSIITIPKHSSQCKYHSTEKPVELMEYFIKTYSLEGEIVLDNSAGSFSTMIACMNLNRQCISIEKDKQMFSIGKERVKEHNLKLDNKYKLIIKED
jgi:site-specific DNA-methyltransferase (adenine-specific)